MKNRSIASTITWEKKPSRTSWLSASPMEFSSPSGTAATSTTSRFPLLKPSASKSRGSYYDRAGALRDMVPNHIMQLISLTSMEPPVSFEADAVRDEQAKDPARHSAAHI